MLSKRQKLIQAKSASADANSNHSIISMFARHRSHSQLQNVHPGTQHVINQIADLSEVTDRPRSDNRLSLSLRKKRLHTDTDDDDSAVGIPEPPCAAFQSTDKISSATNGMQNSSLSAAALPSAEQYQDAVPLISDDQHLDSDCTVNQEDALISGEKSVLNVLPVRQSANETESVHVPYYLENFLLVMDSVFNDTFYAELFNEDDFSALHMFKSLTGNKHKFGYC